MKMKLENVFLVWFAISVISALIFAFTGIPIWVKLSPEGDGLVRFLLLIVFHIGGFLAYPTIRKPL